MSRRGRGPNRKQKTLKPTVDQSSTRVAPHTAPVRDHPPLPVTVQAPPETPSKPKDDVRMSTARTISRHAIHVWQGITAASVLITLFCTYITFRPSIAVLAPQALAVDEVPRPPFVVANTGYMSVFDVEAEFYSYLKQETLPCEGLSLWSPNPGHWRFRVPELKARTQVSFNMQLQAITAGNDTTKIVPLDRGELCADVTYTAWWIPTKLQQRIYYHTAKPDPAKLVWLESLPPFETCSEYIAARVEDIVQNERCR
jgi:hypothetical protein